ncbi:MAG: PP2C family protein-serine/threonine phosphatase [Rhodococcus sp. (in: high G+C Gram-positive bacteria)]
MNTDTARHTSRSSRVAARVTVGAALDLLVDGASNSASPGCISVFDAQRAADVVREEIDGLKTIQGDLTGALVASYDRIHAMKSLAQINLQGAASDETVGLLLDEALALTDSTLVAIFDGGVLVATSGDTTHLDDCARTARRSVEDAPDTLIRTPDGDRAVIATLDPDGGGDGVLAFFRTHGQPFATTDMPVIDAIVSAVGVMLAFTELHRNELERAKVEREHQLASALAQSVIEVQPPRSSTVDIFAKTIPASLTGGDFYVFGETEDHIWFAVGDVAGKGLPAAMLMTRAVAACRVAFLADRDAPVVDVFARIEDELYDHLDSAGVFITLAVGVVSEKDRVVSLVNAGHSPIVVVRESEVGTVPASVPPLGVVRYRVPTVSTVALHGHDCLILGSDGLAEQSDPDGELYGYDRFGELCRSTYGRSASPVGESIFESVRAFANGTSASDDSTLVVFTSGDRT